MFGVFASGATLRARGDLLNFLVSNANLPLMLVSFRADSLGSLLHLVALVGLVRLASLGADGVLRGSVFADTNVVLLLSSLGAESFLSVFGSEALTLAVLATLGARGDFWLGNPADALVDLLFGSLGAILLPGNNGAGALMFVLGVFGLLAAFRAGGDGFNLLLGNTFIVRLLVTLGAVVFELGFSLVAAVLVRGASLRALGNFAGFLVDDAFVLLFLGSLRAEKVVGGLSLGAREFSLLHGGLLATLRAELERCDLDSFDAFAVMFVRFVSFRADFLPLRNSLVAFDVFGTLVAFTSLGAGGDSIDLLGFVALLSFVFRVLGADFFVLHSTFDAVFAVGLAIFRADLFGLDVLLLDANLAGLSISLRALLLAHLVAFLLFFAILAILAGAGNSVALLVAIKLSSNRFGYEALMSVLFRTLGAHFEFLALGFSVFGVLLERNDDRANAIFAVLFSSLGAEVLWVAFLLVVPGFLLSRGVDLGDALFAMLGSSLGADFLGVAFVLLERDLLLLLDGLFANTFLSVIFETLGAEFFFLALVFLNHNIFLLRGIDF